MQVFSCLTVTAQRMAAQNVWVKQLHSVEALGSATVIASDKTGTLTQNNMSVSHVWYDDQLLDRDATAKVFSLSFLGHAHTATSEAAVAAVKSTLSSLLEAAVLCNRSRYDGEDPLTTEEVQLLEASQALSRLDPTLTMSTVSATLPTKLVRFDSFMRRQVSASPHVKALSSPSPHVGALASSPIVAAMGRETGRVSVAQALVKLQGMLAERGTGQAGRKLLGDASDKALFQFADPLVTAPLLRYRHPLLFEVPFNSKSKLAISIVKRASSADMPVLELGGSSTEVVKHVAFLKGAPEVIVAMCSHWMSKGRAQPLDAAFQASFQAACESMGNLGAGTALWIWSFLVVKLVVLTIALLMMIQASVYWVSPSWNWMRSPRRRPTAWSRTAIRSPATPSSG